MNDEYLDKCIVKVGDCGGTICVSISGGSDSDVVLDMMEKCRKEVIDGGGDPDIKYLWVDTGLVWSEERRHIEELEDKYGVEIVKLKGKKSIPVCCKEYGIPFISKYISEMIYRLQKNGFQWEDEDYEVLLQRYPKCTIGIRWWCNKNGIQLNSPYNIGRHRGLKEFMIRNPIPFKVSNKCCEWSKKKALIAGEKGCMMSVNGVRKAEGGVRRYAYSSCFDEKDGFMRFRPLWWMTDEEKEEYCIENGVEHNKLYEWGLKRTGCAGCPFSKDRHIEIGVMQEHDSALYKVVKNTFGESWEYERKWREWRDTEEGRKYH